MADQGANKQSSPTGNYHIYGSSTGTTTGSGTTTGTTGGTWTSLPIPISNGGPTTGTPIPSPTMPSTSTGNGNVTTSTGNAGGTTQSGAIGQLANTLNTLTIARAQPLIKEKIRIVIRKTDGTELMLEEQDVVTPQEMVGLSKFFMLMSCATTVFTQANSGYNIHIHWSEVIKNLSIERHFVSGMQGSVGSTQTNVLDITLFDPT